MEGDDELIDDDKAKLFRTVVCRMIYVSKHRPDIQSTIRWLCRRLKNPNMQSWRQLVKLMRYLRGTVDMCTYYPADGEVDGIHAYFDSDWGGDDLDRKSVMGGAIVVGKCRLHSHSRGGATQVLSSAEGEIASGSELLKEAIGAQHILEFIGFGNLKIYLHTDASAAKSFMHRRGAGRMKHIDIRFMWMR